MSRQMPLKGLRVLDLASFIAGPVATTVMGDDGAEVIKIEPPGGDPQLTTGQRKLGQAHSVPQHPVNFCWHMTNRNKKAMVIDLKSPQGRAVLERLLPTADVMVVNFPPKVRARPRMRYADVASIDPRLIHASMSGYGEQAPDADRPGFDSTAFFARSGLLDALTYEGGPPAFSLPGQGDFMAAEWRKRLRHHEITFGLLGILSDVPHDPQAVANGAVVESGLSDLPQMISAPIRLSFAKPQQPGAGPQPGEHTEALMRELGYSPTEIAALKEAGAVA
jgi:crotonobetainyl-CoA:carnitine CoA-transferase CaiB-like acyl-CoA transferase